MPEWVAEHGIGETRYARISDGRIVEARILLPGPAAGDVIEARLLSRGQGGRSAVARSPEGTEYLLPHGSADVAEGAPITIEITRSANPGIETWKRPLARLTNRPPGSMDDVPARELPFPSPTDLIGDSGWDDLIEEARTGTVRFERGELTIEPARAMTLIDVDGFEEPSGLALEAARAAAAAILRLDIQGSIGIDFPTVHGKDLRKTIAESFDAVLPQPFERTAINGFGFLQLVRPRRRPSLIDLACDRPKFEARALLRRSARSTGPIVLTAHPSVIAAIEPQWTEQLARQAGGAVSLRPDATLAIAAGHAHSA